MFTFYILFSKSLNKYYIGHTGDDMIDRLHRHLTDHKGYTSRAKDWVLVYSESYGQKTVAYQREMEVKNWKSSARIRALLESSSQ